MKSKRVHHGLKWAVCSALLSASTFAAVAPRDVQVASVARLAGHNSFEKVTTENAVNPRLHRPVSMLSIYIVRGKMNRAPGLR